MITIKQLAKELEISPSTVSIVLNGKAEERKISKATQNLILRAAADRGYQPNIAARRLRGGYGADELQVAISWAQDFCASMVARFMEGLREQVDSQNRKIRLVIYPYQNGHLKEARSLFSASDCHAAIIGNASADDLAYLETVPPIIPTVLYNRVSKTFSSATMNHAQIGTLAAEAFAANNGRRAIIVTTESVYRDMDERIQCFLSRANECGLEVTNTYVCTGRASDSRDLINSLLRQSGKENLPDCIFCGSSMTAHGVLRALWENQIPVPETVKIVAVGNGLDEDDLCTIPSLSVVQIQMEKVAAECMKLLLSLISDGASEPITRVIPVSYVPRESCGPLCRAF